MEGILRDSAASYGVHVQQPFVPTSLEFLAEKAKDDTHSPEFYPIKA